MIPGQRQEDALPGGYTARTVAGADLALFRIAGLDAGSLAYTEPVELRCTRCGGTAHFTWRPDSDAEHAESLAILVDWARAHRCPPARLRAARGS